MAKRISILGVTGSIGQSTQDVILSAPAAFTVDTITANSRVEELAQSAKILKARRVIIADEGKEDALRGLLKGTGISVLSGKAAIERAVGPDTDITMAAISGIAGLKPLMGAIQNSKIVAIANKEPIVAAGVLVKEAAKKYGTKILPVDSEHNAVFQVFDEAQKDHIQRIILTASGGPFLNASKEEMDAATPEQALKHPNWDMGAKISIDSATMMNKALEVIEAALLFDMPGDKIDVLIHPQSVVHSMVEYDDGSVLAQMGASDMRTPISYALAWPDRMSTPGERLDFEKFSQLEFLPPDMQRFPALKLAYACLEEGAEACLTMNAANEVAVEAFLRKEIGFGDILNCVNFALENRARFDLKTIDDIEKADEAVRELVSSYLKARTNSGLEVKRKQKA